MRIVLHKALSFLLVILMVASASAPSSAQSNATDSLGADNSGAPVRLRQVDAATAASIAATEGARRPADTLDRPAGHAALALGEFETFVGLPRYGQDMVAELASGSVDYSPVVPPEYVIQGGDELQVVIWGSVDADLRLLVDRAGRVVLPRVGPVMVAGLRYDELASVLTRRVAQVFKNFELSVSLGRLRGVRIYVTGAAARPGAHVVPGLTSVLNAVMRAGGPSAGGSFRVIELRRGGRTVSTLDLYRLLQRGDRSADQLVQPDDVIHVGAVGVQVGLVGSVHKQAVFELLPGETLRELLQMSGGFSAIADTSRVLLERLSERQTHRVIELPLPASVSSPLATGDVVRVLSGVGSALSQQRQNKRVKVEGEVAKPGEYLLPPGSTLNDALRAAGGPTSEAFVSGLHFMRESVRVTQERNYERALRELETDIARTAGTVRVSSSDEAQALAIRSQANSRLIERLQATRPTGRVVLQLDSQSRDLPELTLEDQDRLFVPPKPATVGVFGSVFNGGNYLYTPGRKIEAYLRLAGGMTKGADSGSAFVVRANGSVESARQVKGGWWTSGTVETLDAEAGDTIFVPEEMDKISLTQTVKDWTQVIYQLGIGLAAFQVFTGR